MIFAARDEERGPLSVSLCSRTAPSAEAAETIATLEGYARDAEGNVTPPPLVIPAPAPPRR